METNIGKYNSEKQITLKKKILFSVILTMILLGVVIVVGELSVRTINPQKVLHPRWKFSEKYGFELFENTQMVHERPGHWKFIYTINDFKYRGKLTPISGKYSKKNIIILGDSHSFGTGVNDGEEFAAVMGKELQDEFNVINLSVGGWGLTQQIRRYYEFGQLYLPKIVLLQFCENDPRDNFKNKVVIIENGKFKFQNSSNSINEIKKYLSESIIQKSQIYNLFRNDIYWFFANQKINKNIGLYKEDRGFDDETLPEEQFYNELLELFIIDLNQKGITVMMISVENELDFYPTIKTKVSELISKELIDYLEVISWLKNISDYNTPEGHPWGGEAHSIIGRKIAKAILLKN